MEKLSDKKKTQPQALMIIPTLGERLDLLRQTLESIASQEPYLYDVILVCPRANRARELAREFGAEVVDDPGKGLSAALNAGFANAKSRHKFGSWMGDDDLLRPGCLAATTNALKNSPKSVLAYGYCDYIDDKGHTLFISRGGKLAPWIMRWGPNLLPLMGVLYRLDVAQRVGGYDESLKYSMDLDMWLRLRKYGRFVNTNKLLGAFRWHPSSITVANRRPSLKEAEMVKRRYLPKPLVLIAPLWEIPVRIATRLAVRRVNSLAER